MSFLKNLDWRYATKKFDTNRRVSDADLQQILEAIRKAPTSFGVMPFRVVVVSSQELRNQLQAASYNQPQLGTASHVLVFIARTDLNAMSDAFFTGLSGGDEEIRKNQLAGYESMVQGSIDAIANSGDNREYASNQAFIGLGFALAAAAELQIDSCPMGGFDAKQYQEILGLSDHEFPAVVMPIGYRAEDENPRPKFRLPTEEIFSYKA